MSATWYEVYSLVEGTQDRDTIVGGSATPDADDVAYALAQDLAGVSEVEGPFTWEVYILPHYCTVQAGDECACVQYLTDHHPTFTSDDWEG